MKNLLKNANTSTICTLHMSQISSKLLELLDGECDYLPFSPQDGCIYTLKTIKMFLDEEFYTPIACPKVVNDIECLIAHMEDNEIAYIYLDRK